MAVLGLLKHPNLVTLYGACREHGAYLVYELMEGGSLTSALEQSVWLHPLPPVSATPFIWLPHWLHLSLHVHPSLVPSPCCGLRQFEPVSPTMGSQGEQCSLSALFSPPLVPSWCTEPPPAQPARPPHLSHLTWGTAHSPVPRPSSSLLRPPPPPSCLSPALVVAELHFCFSGTCCASLVCLVMHAPGQRGGGALSRMQAPVCCPYLSLLVCPLPSSRLLSPTPRPHLALAVSPACLAIQAGGGSCTFRGRAAHGSCGTSRAASSTCTRARSSTGTSSRATSFWPRCAQRGNKEGRRALVAL